MDDSTSSAGLKAPKMKPDVCDYECSVYYRNSQLNCTFKQQGLCIQIAVQSLWRMRHSLQCLKGYPGSWIYLALMHEY